MPAGLFNAAEAQQFETTRPAKVEQAEESSSAWMWILGVLLLAAGL